MRQLNDAMRKFLLRRVGTSTAFADAADGISGLMFAGRAWELDDGADDRGRISRVFDDPNFGRPAGRRRARDRPSGRLLRRVIDDLLRPTRPRTDGGFVR